MTSGAPIILTATMGAADFAWADALRRRHFPAARNQVPAHITLFHQLPPFVEGELRTLMKQLGGERAPAAHLSGLLNLGEGVAYRVESPELIDIRAMIAERFFGLLTTQDGGAPRLHITVQNKAKPAVAKALLAELSADFQPRAIVIAGLSAWRYLGGPWEPIADVRFRG